MRLAVTDLAGCGKMRLSVLVRSNENVRVLTFPLKIFLGKQV
jgi:hypothetical protein